MDRFLPPLGAAVLLLGCDWSTTAEQCPRYGAPWCENGQLMGCYEGSGWFDDDEIHLSEDCGAVGAVCREDRRAQAACVFLDQPCDGFSTCDGRRRASCAGGFVSTRGTLECEYACETLHALDDRAHCVRPDDCQERGVVRCTEPSSGTSVFAHYAICVRPGEALDYRCDPRHSTGFDACSRAVTHVHCSLAPAPYTYPDEDGGLSAADGGAP